MRSTWSEKTPSMPMSSSPSRIRSCWASQPKARTSNRWNRVVRPPVQSLWCRLTASMPELLQLGGVALGALLDAGESRVESTRRTCGDSCAPAPPAGRGRRGRATAGAASVGSAAAASATGGRRRPGSLTSSDSSKSVPHRLVELGQRRDVGAAGRPAGPREIRRRRSRGPTTPSWSSTATPSAVSQTSLSRPVAPRRRASSNASSVFSGAWARAPRWAKPMGGSSSGSAGGVGTADTGSVLPRGPLRRQHVEPLNITRGAGRWSCDSRHGRVRAWQRFGRAAATAATSS